MPKLESVTLPPIPGRDLNPYGLAPGQECDRIRIIYNFRPFDATEFYQWWGVVSLPFVEGESWEGTATRAYLVAKEHGGLTAGLMALGQFDYHDGDTDEWVNIFHPAR